MMMMMMIIMVMMTMQSPPATSAGGAKVQQYCRTVPYCALTIMYSTLNVEQQQRTYCTVQFSTILDNKHCTLQDTPAAQSAATRPQHKALCKTIHARSTKRGGASAQGGQMQVIVQYSIVVQ